MTTREPYTGTRRKIVLAFDIGTTFSGISYCLLDPGQVPVIKGVTKFPAQETISGASKIPTIIYYDQQGAVQAVGAEATKDGIFEAALDGDWVKTEWFKLHLRSRFTEQRDLAQMLPPLPLNKTVIDILSDFLQYLHRCAREYITESHANGRELWSSVEDEINYVLSHPNGWEGSEQVQMRKAAVRANLIPDTAAGHDRLSFVTEGEASLHFAVESGVLSEAFQRGDGVVIVDAGGGTVDISSYRNDPEKGINNFEEIAASQCHFHGSVFVSMHAKSYLQSLLANSAYLTDLEAIVGCFDKTTKPRFRKESEAQYIKFGSSRDNDAQCGIKYGQLKLTGTDVAMFFQPSLECIVQAVLAQRQTAVHKVSHVVLVGGFAASDWLFEHIDKELAKVGLNVLRPDNHVNKAVSDGAISFYIDHYVRSRISKMVYGIFYTVNYNPSNPEHVKRESKTTTSIAGEKLLPNAFSTILKRGIQVQETKEFRRDFFRIGKSLDEFRRVTSTLQAYRGDIKRPEWKDIDQENYTPLCTITADLSHLPLKPQRGDNGIDYYKVRYDIVVLFGLTELKAYFAWKEDGVEKRGPAKIIYDPGTRSSGLKSSSVKANRRPTTPNSPNSPATPSLQI